MTQTSENHKGAKVEMKSSCVSCAPLAKDEPIEIVIKWDDKYEEDGVSRIKKATSLFIILQIVILSGISLKFLIHLL